jgi:CubicO group peptidase (beta-lactamase class C family)
MAVKTNSMSTKKAAAVAIAFVVIGCVVVAGFAVRNAGRVMSVASAFYAKTLCSGVFLAKREPQEVIARDVLADMTVGLRHWSGEVDRERNIVTVSLFGLAERRALYRPGLGCTLVTDTSVDALLKQAADFAPPPPAGRSAALWPEGGRVELSGAIEGVDGQKLQNAVDAAFAEPNKRTKRRTRAVVVVHKGRIIAERYAPGMGPQTPQIGWSMGKSVLNALIGTLIAEERLQLEQSKLFAQWRKPGDPRGAITVDNLLRMVSGLDFDEPHARMLSDVRKMLFMKGDSAAYALEEELAVRVASSWFYASGSTTLLAYAMRKALAGSQAHYFAYPAKALFRPLGMNSAVIEPDAAGTFLASAFVYASARDWARLGLLYLNDGQWQGKQILPKGWVKTSLLPTPQSGGQYGAHLWLKIPDFLRPEYPSGPALPEDAFFMLGHDGQMVAIIPSHELVVVRLGLSRRRNSWDHEVFLHQLLQAIAR